MKRPDTPLDEAERVAALHAYDILDTEPLASWPVSDPGGTFAAGIRSK